MADPEGHPNPCEVIDLAVASEDDQILATSYDYSRSRLLLGIPELLKFSDEEANDLVRLAFEVVAKCCKKMSLYASLFKAQL